MAAAPLWDFYSSNQLCAADTLRLMRTSRSTRLTPSRICPMPLGTYIVLRQLPKQAVKSRWSYWHSKIIIDRPHYDVWRLNLLVFFVPLPIAARLPSS